MISVPMSKLRQSAALTTPNGSPQPDGDGNFTQAMKALDPTPWRCAIAPASAKKDQSTVAGTVLAQSTHVLTGRFHSGITTRTVATWVDYAGTTHTANVLGVEDTDGAGVETVVYVCEIVP